MDSKAFFKLSYGVYIISTSADNKEGGCVINTLTQVTSSPAKVILCSQQGKLYAEADRDIRHLFRSGTFRRCGNGPD